MGILLETAESSYFPGFTNMRQDVFAGNDSIYTPDNEKGIKCSTFVYFSTFVFKLFVIELTLVTSSLTSLGGGERHLHLLESPAASV